MSVHVASWAWQQTIKNAGTKLVLLKLADNAHHDGTGSFAGQKRIAFECSMSRRTVQRHLYSLRDLGLVEITPRYENGAQITNDYRIRVPWDSEVPPRQIDAPPRVTGDAPPASKLDAPEPLLEPSTSLEANASKAAQTSENGTSTRELVAHYVDTCRERHGSDPPKRLVGQLARQVKQLVEEGQPEPALIAAIEKVVDGRSPSQLPVLVLEAKAVTTRPRGRSEAAEYVRQHGWPTGSRFAHGSHGGQYVRDPLGHDKPSYAVPWSKPTFDEIAAALARSGEAGGSTEGGAPPATNAA